MTTFPLPSIATRQVFKTHISGTDLINDFGNSFKKVDHLVSIAPNGAKQVNIFLKEITPDTIKNLFKLFSKMQYMHRKGEKINCKWFVSSRYQLVKEMAMDFTELFEFPIEVISV